MASEERYGVLVPTDAMAPRYFAGEVVYMDPDQPARDNDFVVVRFHDGTGMIRRLVSRTATKLTLRQFNPERDLVCPLPAVEAVHRVIGVYTEERWDEPTEPDAAP